MNQNVGGGNLGKIGDSELENAEQIAIRALQEFASGGEARTVPNRDELPPLRRYILIDSDSDSDAEIRVLEERRRSPRTRRQNMLSTPARAGLLDSSDSESGLPSGDELGAVEERRPSRADDRQNMIPQESASGGGGAAPAVEERARSPIQLATRGRSRREPSQAGRSPLRQYVVIDSDSDSDAEIRVLEERTGSPRAGEVARKQM